MTWAAVAIGGAAVVGAGVNMYGANKASNQMQQGDQNAINQQQLQFGQTQQNLATYQQTGDLATYGLDVGMGFSPTTGGWDPNSPFMHPFGMQDFQQSPAYQFNLQQGQQAIDKAANARGNMYAPQTLQDLSKYSQGMASNEFNNAYNQYNQNKNTQFNRLYGLAGMGQNAAVQQGGFGAGMANQVSGLLGQQGNAQAAGTMGMTNAATGAMNPMVQALLLNQQQGQNQQSFSQPYGNNFYG